MVRERRRDGRLLDGNDDGRRSAAPGGLTPRDHVGDEGRACRTDDREDQRPEPAVSVSMSGSRQIETQITRGRHTGKQASCELLPLSSASPGFRWWAGIAWVLGLGALELLDGPMLIPVAALAWVIGMLMSWLPMRAVIRTGSETRMRWARVVVLAASPFPTPGSGTRAGTRRPRRQGCVRGPRACVAVDRRICPTGRAVTAGELPPIRSGHTLNLNSTGFPAW